MVDLPNSPRSYKPSDVAPREHSEEWYKSWAQYIYSLWRDNNCLCNPKGFRAGSDTTIEELRLYGRGMQPVEKYKRILDKQIKLDDNTNAGLLNISWRPPHIMPVYREMIIDRIMERMYDPAVIAIDKPSVEKKELMYFRDKLAATPEAQQLMALAGQVPDNVTSNATVMTQDEIDQFRSLGGYSLAAEIALTEAVQATVDLNRFFPVVYRQVLEDLFDIGFAHIEVSHNPGDRMQTLNYIDPEYAIIPKSQYDDGRDITWGGYMRPITLAALRAESGFDEATISKIAKMYQPYMGNSRYSHGSDTLARQDYAAGVNGQDRFTAMVVTAYFVAAEAESFITGIHDSGARVMDPVKPSVKLSQNAIDKGFSVMHNTVQNVYKVSWVVGTNFVYNYGLNDVIVRDGVPGNMKAMFPIITYRTNKMSVVESCISVVDDLCINVYKKRHTISKMPPAPNVGINVSALEQVTHLGNMKLMPEDLLDIYTVRGILFLAGDQDFGEPFQNGSPPKPIIELPNTSLDQLRTIQIDLQMCMDQLRQITGVNEVADGTKITSGQLSGVTEAYNQSSNRALSWLYTANESIQTQIFSQIAKRYQVVAAKAPMSISYIPVGMDTVQIVNLTPDFSVADFQVIVKPGIDEVAKQALLASVTQYKQNSQISPADEMAVITMISRGRHRMAQFFLASAVSRKAKQDAALAQANAQAQAQAQGEAGVAIEQAKQQGVQAQLQSDMQFMQLEYKLKNDFEEQQVRREIRKNAGAGMSSAMIEQASQTAA